MTFNSLVERNKFIESNLPLVASRVRKRNNGFYNDDLFQEGAKALIEATDRFDVSRGKEFSTYAISYIDNGIRKYKIFDSPIKPIRVNRRWQFKYKDVLSMDIEIDGCCIGDTIQDNNDLESRVTDKIAVKEFLDNLSPKSRFVIDMVMQGVTQENISKMVGINQASVCKLINREGKRYLKSYVL